MKKPKCSPAGIVRYAALLASVFALWWFFRSYLFFLMLFFAAVMPILSIAALQKMQGALSVRAQLPMERIGRGHGAQLKIRTENESRVLPFYTELSFRTENLFTEAYQEEKEQLWIAPGSRVAVERRLTSYHMGRMEVRITGFRIYDWLHLVYVESSACRSAGVIVGGGMQAVCEEDLRACVEGFPQENELKKRGMDVQPDIEVREYRPGDDLKSIHWKLTAKQGKPMVRERLASGRDKMNVLLPLTGDAQENDGLMESLRGLATLLLDKGFPIRLCWLGKGSGLMARYLAEPGELEGALDEILSISGRKDPQEARNRMEEQYPGEAYIAVRNGAYQGEYIR